MMRNAKTMRAILAAAAVLLIAGALLTVPSWPAMSNPAAANKTGQPCAKCHTAPPALNSYGKKYKEGLQK